VQEPSQKVTVTDISMPFGSMVVFILKWTLASIPALIILFLVGLALSTVALGLIRRTGGPGLGSVVAPSAPVDDPVAPTENPPVASGLGAPITGRVHIVRMIGDENGYRFAPADLTVNQGDGIKFVMASGGPHNIAFDPATIPPDVQPQLMANMPNQLAEFSSPLFMNPDESYTISFAKVTPGQYAYHCTPHLAMGMKGTITVR
jgi:plastocyanin